MDNFTQTMAGTAVGIGSIGLVGAALSTIPPDMMKTPRARPMRPMMKRPVTRYYWHKPIGVTAIKRPVIMKHKMNMGSPKMNMIGSGRIDYRKQNKRLVGGAMGILVGVPLLGAAAGMIPHA